MPHKLRKYINQLFVKVPLRQLFAGRALGANLNFSRGAYRFSVLRLQSTSY